MDGLYNTCEENFDEKLYVERALKLNPILFNMYIKICEGNSEDFSKRNIEQKV